MSQIRGLMASSLDGFAADWGGGLGFLEPFSEVDWGYDAFIAQIATVVMGRRTYEQVLKMSPTWPYPGKRAIVLGHGLRQPMRGSAEAWTRDLPALVAHLRALNDGDVWVVGGPMLQSALIAAGALDRLQLCIVPRVLGQGIRTFPASTPGPRTPTLIGAKKFDLGFVMLDYAFRPDPAEPQAEATA